MAQNLVRLFEKAVKPKVETEAYAREFVRLRVEFACPSADDLDEVECFRADEAIERLRTGVEKVQMNGLDIRDESSFLVRSRSDLKESYSPPRNRLSPLERLYFQANWWCEHLNDQGWRKKLVAGDSGMASDPARTATAGTEPQPSGETDPVSDEEEERSELQPFAGSEMVFHEDRIELHGIFLCTPTKPKGYYLVLQSIRKDARDATPEGPTIEDLNTIFKAKMIEVDVAGLVYRLKKHITNVLGQQVSVACGHSDVIVNQGHGYQFAEFITVRDGKPPEPAKIKDRDESNDASNGGDENGVLDDAE